MEIPEPRDGSLEAFTPVTVPIHSPIRNTRHTRNTFHSTAASRNTRHTRNTLNSTAVVRNTRHIRNPFHRTSTLPQPPSPRCLIRAIRAVCYLTSAVTQPPAFAQPGVGPFACPERSCRGENGRRALPTQRRTCTRNSL
jgi:hypothetical protein